MARFFRGLDTAADGSHSVPRARASAQFLGGLGADVSVLGCYRYLVPMLKSRDPRTLKLRLEAIEPHLLVLTKKVGSCRRRQRAEGIGMTVANDVRLTTLLKTLPCVLADRLEHEQPRFREIWQPAQEAVVGQLVET